MVFSRVMRSFPNQLPSTSGRLESSALIIAPPHQPEPTATRSAYILLLLKATGPWTAGGIAFMLIGIGFAYTVILPRIFACPQSDPSLLGTTFVDCPPSFDPHGNVLQNLRTVMQYWLQIGSLISGIGLGKLMEHLVTKRQSTITANLSLTFGALKGNSLDAGLLLLKPRNRSLGVFTLLWLLTTIAIGFVVGRSITLASKVGVVKMGFRYPKRLALPRDVEWGAITNKLASFHWLDIPEESEFRGALVYPDNRTAYAVDPHPVGYRIQGNLTCLPPAERPSISDYWNQGGLEWYNITYHSTKFPIFPTTILHPFTLSPNNGSGDDPFRVLWCGNARAHTNFPTVQVKDSIWCTICNHTIFFSEITPTKGNGVQDINPTELCIGTDEDEYSDHECRRDLVIMMRGLVDLWWRTIDIPVQPNQSLSFPTYGRLDNKEWTKTLEDLLYATMLWAGEQDSAYVEIQDLWAGTESISRTGWWSQGVIPFCTLLLYAACLGYTVFFIPGRDLKIRGLDLKAEFIAAKTTNKLDDLTPRASYSEQSIQVGGIDDSDEELGVVWCRVKERESSKVEEV